MSNLDQSVSFANLPVLVRLDASRIDYAATADAGKDLRPIADDDVTPLPFQIESWDESGSSYVWVRVDDIPSSAETFFYLYFGGISDSSIEDPAVVWESYWGVWHLSESPTAPSPQFADSTGNGSHGSAVNGPISTQTPLGRGLDLTGDEDVVDVGTDLAAVLGSTSTLSAWLRTTQFGKNRPFQSPGLTGVEQPGSPRDVFFGWIDEDGYIGVSAGDASPAASNNPVSDGVWRHFTFIRNHDNGYFTTFVNGVANGSNYGPTGNITTPFSCFGLMQDARADLDAMIDEIRIIPRVIDPARVYGEYKYMVDTHLSFARIEDKP